MRSPAYLFLTIFVFQLAACGGGDSGGTNSQTSQTSNPAPSMPGNFQSTVSGTQNNLSWDASTDDQPAISYKIYRNNYLIGTSTTLSFTDTQMLRGVTYYYRVTAVDNQGNESARSVTLGASAVLADQNILNCSGRQCLFVSASGVDNTATNDGSVNFPFKTVKFALSMINPGGIVYIRAGDYRIPAAAGGEGTISFPTAGTVDNPITVSGYPGETVRFLGSVQLTTWTSVNANVWSHPAPANDIKGMFDNGARITHHLYFLNGVRSHPPLSQLQAGEWTIENGLVYYWPATVLDPNTRSIEASQNRGISINRQFIVVQNLTIEYTQSNYEGGGGIHIAADYAHVRNVKVGKNSKGGENAYAVYFSDCSNSVLSDSEIYDSIYWGGYPNSHVISLIAAGDNGPNIIERNNVHNNNQGLAIGSKDANRNIVIRDNYLHDVVTGISVGGARSAGPGAGRTDRGYYDIYRNVFENTSEAVRLASTSNGNMVYNNLFLNNGTAIRQNWTTTNTLIANNVFQNNTTAVLLLNQLYQNGQAANRYERFQYFKNLGLTSYNNNFWNNTRDWGNQINDWGTPTIITKTYSEVNSDPNLGWEGASLGTQPVWAPGSYYVPVNGSPLINAGADMGLPFNGSAKDIGIAETP